MSGRMFGWIWIDSAVDGSCVYRCLLTLAIVFHSTKRPADYQIQFLTRKVWSCSQVT